MDLGRESSGDAEAPRPSAALPEPVVIGGLLALIALVLLPVLGFGFVYDDGWTFTANGFLRRPQDLPLLLSDEAARRHVPDAFRPALVLFDVITYQLFGLFAPAHHAVSIALHLLVCWLTHRWLAILGAPLPLRAATLALFGLLAIHSEAIAVISFHEDLLAAALGLAGMIAASTSLRTPSSGGRRALLGITGALLLAIGCAAKMSVATLPVLFWLAETLDPWGAGRGQAAPASAGRRMIATLLLCAGVGLAVGHMWGTHGALSPYAGETNLRLHASRVGTSAVLAMSTQIHLGYLQQILLPWGLSPEYVDQGARWGDPATILASAALLSLLLYGLWCGGRRRRPLVALAILGTAILALPTANLAAMPNMRADRLMYLPSLTACLGIAALALVLGRRLAEFVAVPKTQHYDLLNFLKFAPIAALAIIQGAALQANNLVYRSSGALWSVASQRAPGSARAQALYGEMLLASRDPALRDTTTDRRRLAAVRGHCRRALSLDPLDEISHLCMARLAIAEESWALAQASLHRALERSVDRNHRILATLAEVTLDVPGENEAIRREEALTVLTRAIREYPYAVEVWTAAARILHRTGQPLRAKLALRRAYSLAPERVETSLWAIESALDRGDPQLAQELLWSRRRLLKNAAPGQVSALERRLGDDIVLFPTPAAIPGRVQDPLPGAFSR